MIVNRCIATAAFAASALLCAVPAAAVPQPPLPPAVTTFSSGSLRVAQYGSNSKRAIVLLPGLLCGPWEFSREIEMLGKDATVYAVTLPGFDGNAPAQAPLFARVSDDLWRLFADRHIDRPIIIGHSLGGTLALMLATQHPEQLRGVVAIDGLPVFPGAERQTPEQRAQAAAQFRALFARAKTLQELAAMERTYSLPYLVTSPADVDSIATLSARSDPSAAAAWASEAYQIDLRRALTRARVPILEIAPYDAAERMLFATTAQKQRYYESLLAGAPLARVEVLSGSKHFAMYDQPAAVDAALTRFIGGLDVTDNVPKAL